MSAALQVHWLNGVVCESDESYVREESERLEEVGRLILGSADDQSQEAAGVFLAASESGNTWLVGRIASSVRSLIELKYRVPYAERAVWVRACYDAGYKASQLAASEKLLDAARRLLEVEPRERAGLRTFYETDSIEILQGLRLCALESAPFFASSERMAGRRRALCGFYDEARRYASPKSALSAWTELEATIRLGGPKSHDANLALGMLRICLPTEGIPLEVSRAWLSLWCQWTGDACCAEADAAWLTLLCRSRKTPQLDFDTSDGGVSARIFHELYRRTGVPVGGARALESTWRAWPSRYRWLALVGGDAPHERCLRKLAKLAIACLETSSLARLAKMLRPYFHPSNSGSWTPRLGVVLSELSRELASACAKRRLGLQLGRTPSENQSREAVALLAPLARDALYSRHSPMVAAAIASLRDLCGVHPRLVAEVCVPTLRSALVDESAVLWAHQAPAALRCFAALARPLVLRRAHWTQNDDSDNFLQDPLRAQRAAFFGGTVPSADRDDSVDNAIARDPPLSCCVSQVMRAALAAVDASDDNKTRCCLLFFDAVLRWLPIGEEVDNELVVVFDQERGALDEVAAELSEDWAHAFLDRLLANIEHRDAAAKIPNLTMLNADARYAGVVASARDAASAELVRSVTTRLAWRLSAASRRRAVSLVANWIRDAPPRAASAKDAASVVAAFVGADVGSTFSSQKIPSAELVDQLRDALCNDASDVTPARLAFTMRLMAGAARASHPARLAAPRFVADLVAALDLGLHKDDKAVRKASRKLLRDALRGLLERRPYLKRLRQTDWPDDRVDADQRDDATRAVGWVNPTAESVRVAARLLDTFVVSPLAELVKGRGKDGAKTSTEDDDDDRRRAKWLLALRQFTHGVRGACCALDDEHNVTSPLNGTFGNGARTRLVRLLVEALNIITTSPALRLDAKLARASLKSARALLTLRRSCHVYRARASVSAIRARRRAFGVDAAARVYAHWMGAVEHRGDDDRVERAASHYWMRCLDAAHRDVRVLSKLPDVASCYQDLIGACGNLAQHLYADVRSAALDVVDACWPFYAWALKPRLSPAIASLRSSCVRAAVASSDAAHRPSSRLLGVCALLTTRSAVRKLTADKNLGAELCEAAVDFGSTLASLPLDERDDVAERLDGLVAVYAARHCRPPMNAARLAEIALAKASDASSHWRHRFVAAFVATHALSATAFTGESTDEVCQASVLDAAATGDDEPTPRLALCALMRKVAEVHDGCGLSDTLRKTLRDYFAHDQRLAGLVGALQREHRRERARDSDDAAQHAASPIVEALVKESRHAEPWAVFPKSMAPYSSRGFRSRHARFVKRLVRLIGDGSARRIVAAAQGVLDAAPPTERGAACAAAAEAWAGAVRVALRSDMQQLPLGDEDAAFYFEVLRRAIRYSSPEHALCWADAVRYAAGGKAAGAFAQSALLESIQREWESAIRDPGGEDTTWAQTAKVLALAPSVLYEFAAQDVGIPVARRLADALLSDAGLEHRYAAVRERVGQCLGALSGGALPLGAVISLKTVDRVAVTCLDSSLSVSDAVRRRRETALAWARNAARDGELRVVARIVRCMLDSLVDPDEDHRALASATLGTAMHCARPPATYDGLADLAAAIVAAASHPKWRARAAVATFLGSFSARFAFVLRQVEADTTTAALRTLASDDAAEVRDAACASLASLVASAPNDHLAKACLNDAAAQLDTPSAHTVGAVHALGAAVLAFPYDVPAHVPDSLVVLAKHSNRANNLAYATIPANSNKRTQAGIKDAVKATFAEFKRTHAETWHFIKPFFTPDQHDAFADILTTGDYLV